MKKHRIPLLLLSSSLLLGVQVTAQDAEDVELNDVVIVEDADPAPTETGESTDNSSAESSAGEVTAVIEVPEEEIEGASIDVEVPVIEEATEALPGETEIVLDIPGQGAAAAGEATMEGEETISVDFPDEDVRTILRNVADLFDLNLVIPDTLQGRTSVKLRNITWRQVFEVVLEPLGFTYVEDRNIIRVKSIEELTTEPVDTRVFVANYAKASDIRSSISPLVDTTIGGQIQVDSRSNALVITERPSRMNKIQEIIDRLDQPNHQVMIESKFIEVSQADVRRVGVDWAFLDQDQDDLFGGNAGFSNNVPDGATGPFPDPVDLATGNSATGLLAVFSRQEFGAVVNALDDDNSSRLVSQPTVVVMNNSPANFEVGVDYPIREITFNPETGTYESGALEKEFIGVKLDVTPSVNAEGMISLDVGAELSELGGAGFDDTVPNPAGGADPIISKRQSNTNVTIKDGFTIALGGLLSATESVNDRGVPVFKEIPVLGRLFNTKTDDTGGSNLIIFITASTLNPDGTSYREIIDPRMLDAVGHTDSQAPGYVVPHEDMELLRQAEKTREQLEDAELKRKVQQRLDRQAEQKKSWQEKLKLTNPEK